MPKEIKNIFREDQIIVTNPYDSIKLCEDVSNFTQQKKISFHAVTTFFEMCVYQTACLADYLDIKRKLSIRSALKTSVNKYLMRLEIEKSGLNQPKFIKFDDNSIKKAFRFLGKISGPAIIKPIHSGHSYGVRYIEKGVNFNAFKKLVFDARKDYQKNYDEWMKYEDVNNVNFLLEEFIEGRVYSIDGIVDSKGKITFIGSTEFEMSTPPIMQQIGHTTPIYSLSSSQLLSGYDYVKKVISGLELTSCGFHCELKYFDDEPMLIEVSGRLPGGVITRSYQNLLKYNLLDKFFSVFDETSVHRLSEHKVSCAVETMKIVHDDNRLGIVINAPGNIQRRTKDYICEVRSRKKDEIIYEGNNTFGTWLYEIVLRSKTLSAKELITVRDNFIEKQKTFIGKSRLLNIDYIIGHYIFLLKQFLAKMVSKQIINRNV